MTAIQTQHGRIFERLARDYRQTLLETMALGIGDISNYWILVGHARGMDTALRLSEQADFEISGEEPDGSA